MYHGWLPLASSLAAGSRTPVENGWAAGAIAVCGEQLAMDAAAWLWIKHYCSPHCAGACVEASAIPPTKETLNHKQRRVLVIRRCAGFWESRFPGGISWRDPKTLTAVLGSNLCHKFQHKYIKNHCSYSTFTLALKWQPHQWWVFTPGSGYVCVVKPHNSPGDMEWLCAPLDLWPHFLFLSFTFLHHDVLKSNHPASYRFLLRLCFPNNFTLHSECVQTFFRHFQSLMFEV